MRFGAGRGRIGLVFAFALAASIGAGAALAGGSQDDVGVVRVADDDPDAEIPSDALDFLLTPDEADVELLPYWMGGRDVLENVRFDVGDEFA